MAYKEINEIEDEVNFVRFEKEGDEFEGTLVEVKPSDKYGYVYTLEKNGETYLLIGKLNLNAKMKHIELGNKVKIILDKLTKTEKKNTLKLFKVFVDDNNFKE